MATRALGAVLVVVVALAPLVIGGPAFALLMAGLGLASWREYLHIARNLTPAPGVSRYGATTIALLAVAGLLGWPLPVVVAVGFVGLLAPLVRQFRRSGEPDLLTYWGLGAAGSLYIGLPVLAATNLRQIEGTTAPWLARLADLTALGWTPAAYGLAWTFTVVLCTWLADTGAYLVGRQLGRRRMSRRISPNKTVEGAIGGLVAAVAAGSLCWTAFELRGGWQLGAAIGLALGVVGQVGDFAESFIKRQAGVKDSGSLIPGHGGVFDRVDALFVAFPVAWLLAAVIHATTR